MTRASRHYPVVAGPARDGSTKAGRRLPVLFGTWRAAGVMRGPPIALVGLMFIFAFERLLIGTAITVLGVLVLVVSARQVARHGWSED